MAVRMTQFGQLARYSRPLERPLPAPPPSVAGGSCCAACARGEECEGKTSGSCRTAAGSCRTCTRATPEIRVGAAVANVLTAITRAWRGFR